LETKNVRTVVNKTAGIDNTYRSLATLATNVKSFSGIANVLGTNQRNISFAWIAWSGCMFLNFSLFVSLI
jgi:hypothetical protein